MRSQRKSSRPTIAIIGGGFTGAILAAQLLRREASGVSVVVIEKYSLPGRGVAYGTQCSGHLLNVPAGNMSAFPEEPEHFLRWARANHDAGAQPRSFLPRRVYGEYVASVLEEAVETYGRHRLQWRHDEVRSISLSGKYAEIKLRSGSPLAADRIVLALGNFPPSHPKLPGRTAKSSRYVSFAWSQAALEGLEKARGVLLIGSGLTSVDQVIGLRANGFRGKIHVLSRHGLFPQVHQATQPWPVFWSQESPRTIRSLLRLVRENVQQAQQQGIDWRAVMDSMRSVTAQIWQSLSHVEKKRFLRHVRPYWDIHRHRIAPEIAELVVDELAQNRIHPHSGRITSYRENPMGVAVRYRDRHSGREETISVDRVINCTGPETDCRRLDDPLMANLRSQGLVRPDQLYLGLDVSTDGALIGNNGMASDFLYAVGPARKAMLWESTAVPEIRQQVAELTSLLLSQRFCNQPERSVTEEPHRDGARCAQLAAD